MTAYRDSFEKCPRCGVELRDARSARGCEVCGGLFVEEAVLTEMIQEMLPPGPLVRLQLAQLVHPAPPIGCPSCGVKMEQTKLLDVPIERCEKHGVWFDRDELATALYRATITTPTLADASSAAPPSLEPAQAVAFDPAMFVDEPQETTTPVAESRPVTPALPETIPERPTFAWFVRDGSEPVLDLHVREPDGRTNMFHLSNPVTTIGRGGASSSVSLLLPHASVSGTHAGIYIVGKTVTLSDLASSSGTFVNGVQINKCTLQPGDEIQIGVYRMRVGKPFPETAEQLFDRYVAAAVADRSSDPLVVRVNERVGDRDFHTYVKLSVQSLKMQGKRFTLDTHAGLRDVIRDLVR